MQSQHPEVVVVAMNVLDDKAAADKIVQRYKLDNLRIAPGQGWQDRFELPEGIPVTVVVDHGRVRVVHDGVLPDPVAYLEADLTAVRAAGGKTASP